MKIALINGSPKIKKSASNCILGELKILLAQDHIKISKHHFKMSKIGINDMDELLKSNVMVFVFPLYVDAIPSHLLNCLIQLEDFVLSNKIKDIMVYSIVNCGFYEGHQNKIAIQIMENWCEKSELRWGQGIGIGGGGMIPMMAGIPKGYGPRKNLDKALKQLANNIIQCDSEENIFISPNFPRIAYKFAGERGFRQTIKANGLRTRDLYLKK